MTKKGKTINKKHKKKGQKQSHITQNQNITIRVNGDSKTKSGKKSNNKKTRKYDTIPKNQIPINPISHGHTFVVEKKDSNEVSQNKALMDKQTQNTDLITLLLTNNLNNNVNNPQLLNLQQGVAATQRGLQNILNNGPNIVNDIIDRRLNQNAPIISDRVSAPRGRPPKPKNESPKKQPLNVNPKVKFKSGKKTVFQRSPIKTRSKTRDSEFENTDDILSLQRLGKIKHIEVYDNDMSLVRPPDYFNNPLASEIRPIEREGMNSASSVSNPVYSSLKVGGDVSEVARALNTSDFNDEQINPLLSAGGGGVIDITQPPNISVFMPSRDLSSFMSDFVRENEDKAEEKVEPTVIRAVGRPRKIKLVQTTEVKPEPPIEAKPEAKPRGRPKGSKNVKKSGSFGSSKRF